MSKVRINELARELEVKPNRILELLPEFGVEEKKTHSSSIDEDVAIAIKRKLVSGSDSDVASRSERESYRAVAVADDDDEPEESSRQEEPERRAPFGHVDERAEERVASPARAEAPKVLDESAPTPAAEAVADAQKAPVMPSRPSPLRPPLASGPLRPPTAQQHVAAPPVPQHAPPVAPVPPAAPGAQSGTQASAQPGTPNIQPGTPAQPLPRPAGPGVPQPQQQARPAMPAPGGRDVPIFSPKPGQAPQRPSLPSEPGNRTGGRGSFNSSFITGRSPACALSRYA